MPALVVPSLLPPLQAEDLVDGGPVAPGKRTEVLRSSALARGAAGAPAMTYGSMRNRSEKQTCGSAQRGKMRRCGHEGVARTPGCGTDGEGLSGGGVGRGGHIALPGAVLCVPALEVCRQRCGKVPAAGAGLCGGCVVFGGAMVRHRSAWS